MNALSRVSKRTRIISGLFLAVGVAAIASTVIRAIDSQPELQVTFLHYQTKDEDTYAVVDIRNVGNAPAQFRGYSKTFPACELVHKDSAGVWQNRILRCGTGLMPQLLFPDEQIRTTNYVYSTGNWKVGLSYSKPQFRDRLPPRIQSYLRFLPSAPVPYSEAWTPEMPAVKVELASASDLLLAE